MLTTAISTKLFTQTTHVHTANKPSCGTRMRSQCLNIVSRASNTLLLSTMHTLPSDFEMSGPHILIGHDRYPFETSRYSRVNCATSNPNHLKGMICENYAHSGLGGMLRAPFCQRGHQKKPLHERTKSDIPRCCTGSWHRRCSLFRYFCKDEL